MCLPTKSQVCFAVTCLTLSGPDNGMVSLSTDGEQTVAAFSCSSGFSLQGSPASLCLTDGSWSNPPPQCGNMSFIITCRNVAMAFKKYSEWY